MKLAALVESEYQLPQEEKQAIAEFADQNRKFMERFADYITNCGFQTGNDILNDATHEALAKRGLDPEGGPRIGKKSYDDAFDEEFEKQAAETGEFAVDFARIEELFKQLRRHA